MDRPSPAPLPDDPTALKGELERLRLSEARFRARLVADFAQRDAADRAHLDRIDRLERILGERDTAIHNLNLELAALVRARTEDAQAKVRLAQALHADLEWFVHRLQAAEAEAAGLRRRGFLGWLGLRGGPGAGASLPGGKPVPVAAGGLPAPSPGPAPTFVYYLHTSPYRVFRAAPFTLRGWARPSAGGPVTGIRVRIGAREFIGRHGLEDADAQVQPGSQAQADNPKPGFEVGLELPEGEARLILEAQLGHTAWFPLLATPVWRLP